MKPPSSQARLVLERYKASATLAAGEKARLGHALHERVLRGDLPRFDVPAPSPVATPAGPAPHLWSGLAAKVGLAALALGTAGGVAYSLRGEAPARPTAAAVVPRPSVLAERAAGQAVAPAPVPEARRLDEALPKDVSPAPRASTGKVLDAVDAASEATIDEEVKLLNGAQAALRSGDTTRALQLLGEHATRFATGKLASARQVTRMMALCQAGQAERARQEAATFLSKNPSSPLAERVKRICPP